MTASATPRRRSGSNHVTTRNHHHDHDAGPTTTAGAVGRADRDEFAPPSTDLEVFSVRDVARLFGRTERTVRNWVRAGRLQRGGFGRSVFFSRAAIDALLRGETSRPELGPSTSSP